MRNIYWPLIALERGGFIFISAIDLTSIKNIDKHRKTRKVLSSHTLDKS